MEYKDPIKVSPGNYRLIPDGHAMKHEPWTHPIENIGATDIKAILFERK